VRWLRRGSLSIRSHPCSCWRRHAGFPILAVVHRGGACREDTPAVELDPGVAPVPEEPVRPTTQPGSFSTTGLDIMRWERGTDSLLLRGVATCGGVRSTRRWAVDVNDQSIGVVEACADANPTGQRVLTEQVDPRQGTVRTPHAWLRRIGVAGSRSGSGGKARGLEEG
jgi:nicotinamidase-related amidase